MSMATELAKEWNSLESTTGRNAEKLALKIFMYLNARVCTWEDFVVALGEESE